MSTAIERAEARRQHAACVSAVEAAKTHAVGLWDALAEVHRLEAWRVTGHSSFTEWAKVELNVSGRQSYRYLAKAREVVAIAEQTGITTTEAAESVTLTPKPVRSSRSAKPVVIDSWAKPVKAAGKLTTALTHLRVEVPLSPAARTALTELLQSIETVLRAR